MALKNPTVGATGFWKLNAPFNNLLPVNVALECTAISNYGQCLAMGIDPYETYYKPHSITKEDYQKHIDEEGRIIFLKTLNGKRYSFPLHYLDSYPVGKGVLYGNIGILVRLGILPININTDLLLQQIEEVCNLNVGVDIHAEAAVLSDTKMISNADHDRLVQARESKKKAKAPSLQRLVDLQTKNDETAKKLKLAETKLIEFDGIVRSKDDRIAELEKKVKDLGGTP